MEKEKEQNEKEAMELAKEREEYEREYFAERQNDYYTSLADSYYGY